MASLQCSIRTSRQGSVEFRWSLWQRASAHAFAQAAAVAAVAAASVEAVAVASVLLCLERGQSRKLPAWLGERRHAVRQLCRRQQHESLKAAAETVAG